MQEYKKNTDDEKIEPKRTESVVANPVTTKKKSRWEQIKEEFISEDGKSVGDFLLFDVLVPAIKKTLFDMGTNGLDMILYGGKAQKSSNPQTNKIPYRNFYEEKNYSRPRPAQVYSNNDIVFQTRGDADAVLNGLNDIVAQYGIARVADYYDLAGVNCSYTDNYYGWTDLRMAQVVRLYSGFSLKLPKPMPID